VNYQDVLSEAVEVKGDETAKVTLTKGGGLIGKAMKCSF